MDMGPIVREEFWPLVLKDVQGDPVVPSPVADPNSSNCASSATEPNPIFSQVALKEHYPAWFPRILEAIRIRARSPRQYFEQLHASLREFSGPSAEETDPSEDFVADGPDSDRDTGSESVSEDSVM